MSGKENRGFLGKSIKSLGELRKKYDELETRVKILLQSNFLCRQKHNLKFVHSNFQIVPYKFGFNKWNVPLDETAPSAPKKAKINTKTAIATDPFAKISQNQNITGATDTIYIDNDNFNCESVNAEAIESAEIYFVDVENDQENANTARFSNILSGKYFSVISRDEKFTKAKCTICNGTYSATKNTTSNFVRHLKVNKIFYTNHMIIFFISEVSNFSETETYQRIRHVYQRKEEQNKQKRCSEHWKKIDLTG